MSARGLDRRDALALGAGAVLLPYASAAVARTEAGSAPAATGRDQPFNDGWLFHRGLADGLEAVSASDSGWRRIDLPHDWSIEDVPGDEKAIGPFTETAVGNTATGFTVGGEGWYRKHFNLAGVPRDAGVEIEFDGVYCECDVWLNGVHLVTHHHGYAPFAADLTPHLVRDGGNVLAVRVRNLGRNSRWYSGSGIYREVRLHVMPAGARFARWGIGAWTRRIAGGAAEVEVTTRIDDADPTAQLVSRLRDAQGRVVATATSPASGEIKQVLAVRGAHLWSPTDPYLHTLESELQRGGKAVDRVVQPYGLRIVTIDPQRGLAINGERTVLRGGCIHHDNGLLGACAYPQADERRIRLLKARGFNAIRSSHNPASRSLRSACDRLGMLMI
ncbi:MAG: hypothetical protein JF593_01960, partial [Novosphingobium sp.]|nr:hypothetical protein [Novosphingobium sp.]